MLLESKDVSVAEKPVLTPLVAFFLMRHYCLTPLVNQLNPSSVFSMVIHIQVNHDELNPHS